MFFSVASSHLLSVYGYWAIAGIVGLEGIGIPIPGETTLILAAVYAGSTHHLDIRLVIVAAAAGSIVGSIIGFWIGREIGYPLLLRYGHYVGLTESKIKIGQYLLDRVLRSLRPAAPHACRLARRGQSHALASLPAVQHGGQHLVDLRVRSRSVLSRRGNEPIGGSTGDRSDGDGARRHLRRGDPAAPQ